jgi:hypothetical protein
MMRSVYNLLAVMACIIVLSSCATPYQSKGGAFSAHPKVGYVDKSLGDGRFEVTYLVNAVTPKEKSREFAHRRSAEICVENGYLFFQVISESATYKKQTQINKHGPTYVDFPQYEMEIQCLKEDPLGDSIRAQDLLP